MVHLVLQNFNIYAMNSYHYNLDLMFYSTFVLLKHMAATTVSWINPTSVWKRSLAIIRVCVQAVIGLGLVLFGAALVLEHEPLCSAMLVLPWVAYLALFGWRWHFWSAADSSCGFDLRLKFCGFRVFEAVYNAGFLPVLFVKYDYLYFDSVQCNVVMLCLATNAVVLFTTRLVATNSQHFQQSLASPSIVSKSQGSTNLDAVSVTIASVMLLRPGRTLNLLLTLQLFIASSQFCLMLFYSLWVWVFVMLVSNLALLYWVVSVKNSLYSVSSTPSIN
eukprot:TRINITY_DN20152_c0_g2_i2.p1 TRINITY_DN20152_c0_g2~~TRINITY_DN20152_c0_g2_i2.p1  ORF type:complete len:276 (-),score=30.52 TRINITY_DN20152_c0_g2_i2:191-1018(-)